MGEEPTGTAAKVDRGARQSRLLDAAVRFGLLAYGSVHLLIAWVAIRLVFDRGAGSATGQGALAQLAMVPLGRVTLAALVCSFTALVVWQLIAASVGFRDHEGWTRRLMQVAALGRAGVYVWFGWASARLALQGASASAHSPQSATARLLHEPGGAALLVAVGLFTAVMGVVLAGFGVRKKFLVQFEPAARRTDWRLPIVVLGQCGYVLKGLAFVVVGLLLGWAALTRHRTKSGGLDQSLYELLGHGMGAVAVVVIGAGISCFGLYCFAWSRHLHREAITS